MTERTQITHMQVRIARMASEKWNLPIDTVAKLFSEYGVFEHIRACFGLYHTEGDEAIWYEMKPFFEARGCPYA